MILAPSRPKWWRVLLAPWIYMLRPSKAANCFADASRPTLVLSYGLGVCCLAALWVALSVWDATVEVLYGSPGRPFVEKPPAQVWAEWHEQGWFGPAEAIASLVVGLTPVATAFAAWLLLPSVHRTGSVWRSFGRAFAAVASGVGLLTLLKMIVGATIRLLNFTDRRSGLTDELVFPCMILAAACCCGLIVWLSRAATSVCPRGAASDPPPMCEGCGYDLTHRPADGLCPECGFDVAKSLTPGLKRTGCAWEGRRGATDWLGVTIAVLMNPAAFYGRLRLRTPDGPARRYALWHFILIGMGAACWMVVTGVFVEPMRGPEIAIMCMIACLFMLLIPLIGWSLHRFIGAVVSSWWIMRGALPDMRWGSKVLAYETVYLWAFCLYNGCLVSSFIRFNDWISDVLDPALGRLPLGMPWEVLALLLGNGLLCLNWLRRYGIAAREIRWSNF